MVLTLVAMCGLAALLDLSTFRFLLDDYYELVGMIADGARLHGGERLISVDLLFRVGVALGGSHLFFQVANGAALLIGAWTFRALLLRLGAEANEAVLAAGLYVANPAAFHLLVRATGFQWLAAGALIMVALWLITVAGQTLARGRRAVALVAALTTLALTVFVKYPVTLLLPIVMLLWSRRVVALAGDRVARGAWPVIVLGAFYLPLALVIEPSIEHGEIAKIGPTWALPNTARLFELVTKNVAPIALLSLLLGVGSGPKTTGDTPWWRSWKIDFTDSAQRPLGATPTWVLAGSLSLLLLFPALFRRTGIPGYYLFTAFPWLVLPFVRTAARRDSRGRTPAWAAFLAVLLLVPVHPLFKNLRPSPWTQAEGWAHEVGRDAPVTRPPDGLIVEARCGTEEATRLARAELRDFYLYTEQGYGIRWFRRWWSTQVLVRESGEFLPSHLNRSPAGLILEAAWCPTEALRYHVRRTSKPASQAPPRQ